MYMYACIKTFFFYVTMRRARGITNMKNSVPSSRRDRIVQSELTYNFHHKRVLRRSFKRYPIARNLYFFSRARSGTKVLDNVSPKIFRGFRDFRGRRGDVETLSQGRPLRPSGVSNFTETSSLSNDRPRGGRRNFRHAFPRASKPRRSRRSCEKANARPP